MVGIIHSLQCLKILTPVRKEITSGLRRTKRGFKSFFFTLSYKTIFQKFLPKLIEI